MFIGFEQRILGYFLPCFNISISATIHAETDDSESSSDDENYEHVEEHKKVTFYLLLIFVRTLRFVYSML